VLDHLKEQSGSHFDPQVVEAFSSLIGGVDDGQWTTDDGQLFN
jgi:HD-GYP domain-containing protein (c-di-GMP phosphodiesterase class II)